MNRYYAKRIHLDIVLFLEEYFILNERFLLVIAGGIRAGLYAAAFFELAQFCRSMCD